MLLGLVFLAQVAVAEPEPVRVGPIIDLRDKTDPVAASAARAGNDIVWHGLRVHFSSAASAAKFRAKPDDYLDRLGLARTGRRIDLKNKKCPVTGKAVDGKTFADVEGVRWKKHAPAAK